MFSTFGRFVSHINLRRSLIQAHMMIPYSMIDNGLPALYLMNGLQNVEKKLDKLEQIKDENQTEFYHRIITQPKGSGDYFFNGMPKNRVVLYSGANNSRNRRSMCLTNHAKACYSSSTDTDDDPSLSWKSDGQKHENGPDQILPSNAIYTWRPEGAVRISNLGEGEPTKWTPISVPALLDQAVERAPDRIALAVKRNNEWQKWTYTEYQRDVRTVAKAFIALGLERYHSVCILGFNTPEWFIACMAAIHAGGFAAGIYTTNSPEACAYVAKDSKANIFVVEDEIQLAKILRHKDELPNLKAIIQYTGDPKIPGVYSWSKLLMLGEKHSNCFLKERLKKIAINQCCTLIYTSGTTGKPKGVMLSHDNVTWMVSLNQLVCNFRPNQEEYISFLPLSHVAAQVADVYCSLTCSASVYFADKDVFKGTLIDTMRDVRPTKFLAVPRVWEKIHEKLLEIGASTTGIKKAIATWAKTHALNYNMKRMQGVPNPATFSFKIADKVILSRVRDALGLDRCDLHLSGAAPINPEVLKYFMSLNIVVTEAYGMSECSGPHTMSVESAFRLGSVGKTLPGCVTRLDNPDADGNGEICMGGRHVQMGYLNHPEKTRNAIDEQGWLHSEDVGKIDKDGYVFITGRIKELLITAGGENVAPVPIEDNVKTALPIVSQAMVLGNKLKFLSILLTLKTDVDKDTQEPLDNLLPVTIQWIKENCGCDVQTVQDVINEIQAKKNLKLVAAIQAGIDEANKKAISHAQIVQKWHILPKDFSIPGGELGPTLKLKRSTVVEKYKDVIEDLYNVNN